MCEETPRVEFNSTGKAIQLIGYTSKEGFKVSSEGRTFLQSLKNKIGVIAVAGKYRTGKSFLLNRIIMGRLKGGFGVGSTINACTKGIWVWNEPIKIKSHDGEEFDVLVMDSEGIGAMDEDQNHDTRIFLLATLLSSLLIYNSVGTIDEGALQNLSLIVNMSKQLQIRSQPGKEFDPEELKSYFPSFLWVLRDFTLRLIDLQGNPITPKQYLENALFPQKGNSDNIELKNRIRRVITSVFNERDCFSMVRPLEDEKAIQNLQEIPDASLRPEFAEQMRLLRQKVCKKVKPKRLNGNYITGEMLLELCYAYTKAFNTGGVPCIESAWNYMCKSQCQKTMEETIGGYEEELKKHAEECGYDSEKIKAKNKELKEKMIKHFKNQSIGELATEYEESLKQKIAEKYEEIKKASTNKITAEFEDKLEDVYKTFEEKIMKGAYKQVIEIKIELEKWKDKELKAGPKFKEKQVLINKLIEKLVVKTAEKVADQCQFTCSFEVKKAAEKTKLVEAQLEKLKEELEATKRQYEERIESTNKSKVGSEAQVAFMTQKIAQLEKELAEKDVKWKSATTEREAELVKKFADYKEKIHKLEDTLSEKEKEVIRIHAEAEKAAALADQRLNYTNTKVEEIEKKLQSSHKDYSQAKQKLEEKERLVAKLKEEFENAQLEHDAQVMKLKISLEREIAEWKTKAEEKKVEKAANEWKLEKEFLEKQLGMARSQMEENRKLYDSLKSAIDKATLKTAAEDSQDQAHLLEVNKNLSATLGRMEKRSQILEQKVERMKRFQKMVKSSCTLQCKFCNKILASEVFSAHLSVCSRDKGSNSLKGFYQRLPLKIDISQTLIKEESKSRPYTEYVLQVSYNNKKWTVNRKYRAFCELHEKLLKEYPHVRFPDTAIQFMTKNVADILSLRKMGSIEERRTNLQKYLADLALIPLIRESATFRQFIGMDVQCPEEYENLVSLNGSYFLSKGEDTIENIVDLSDPADPLSPAQS